MVGADQLDLAVAHLDADGRDEHLPVQRERVLAAGHADAEHLRDRLTVHDVVGVVVRVHERVGGGVGQAHLPCVELGAVRRRRWRSLPRRLGGKRVVTKQIVHVVEPFELAGKVELVVFGHAISLPVFPDCIPRRAIPGDVEESP